MAYRILAAPGYSSPAVTFLLAVIVAVFTILGVIVAYWALRSTTIRRRIRCSVLSNVDMPSSMPDLEIEYQDEQLEDPYIVTIEIANSGPEIPLKLFSEDQWGRKRGIEFDLGVLIHRPLSHECVPSRSTEACYFC